MSADKFLGQLWVGLNVDTTGLANAAMQMEQFSKKVITTAKMTTQAGNISDARLKQSYAAESKYIQEGINARKKYDQAYANASRQLSAYYKEQEREALAAEKAMAASTKGMSVSLNSLSNNLYRFGTFATMAFTAPLTLLATNAVKMAAELEQIKQKTVSLANVSQEQMDAWGGAITRIGIATNQTSKSIAQSLYFVASAGVDNANAIKLVEYAAKGAAIGLGETDTIAKLLTYTYNAYGKEVFDATKRMDELTIAVREGAAEAGDLAGVMGDLVPVAAQIGVSFADLGGMLAGMTQIGLNSHKSATALRQIMMEMIRPSHQAGAALDAAAKKMNDMSISSMNLAKTVEKEGLLPVLIKLKNVSASMGPMFLPTVFDNIRSYTGLMSMIGPNMEKVLAIVKKTKEEVGAFDTALGIMTQTSQFKLGQFKKAAEQAFLNLGETLIPALLPLLQSLTETINNLTTWFKSLSSSTQELIMEFGLFLAVLGPLSITLSGLVRLWAIIGMSMTGMIIPAINAVGSALVWLSGVMLANPYIAMAAGMGILLYSLNALNDTTRELTEGEKILLDVEAKATQSVVAQKVAIEQLMLVATNANATLDQKQKAIKTINSISREYLDGINQETIRTGEATRAINLYLKSLELKAEKEAVYAALVELNKKRAMELATGSDKDLNKMQYVQTVLFGLSPSSAEYKNMQIENATIATEKFNDASKRLWDRWKMIPNEIARVEQATVPITKVLSIFPQKGSVLDPITYYTTKEYINDMVNGMSKYSLLINNKQGTISPEFAPIEDSEKTKRVKNIMDTLAESLKRTSELSKIFNRDISTGAIAFDTSKDPIKAYATAIEALIPILGSGSKEVKTLLAEFRKLYEVDLSKPWDQSKRFQTWFVLNSTGKNQAFTEKTGIMDNSIAGLQDPTAGWNTMIGRAQNEKILIRNKEWRKSLRDVARAYQEVGQAFTSMLSSYVSLISMKQQAAYTLIDNIAKREGKSAEWVAKQKERIDADINRKKKQAAMSEAMINIAVGVTKAWAAGPIVGPILAALTMAAGLAQLAVINAQPMAKGGIVPGGYNNDTYPAMLSSGEMVIPPNKLPNMIGAGRQTIHLTGKLVADGRDMVYVFNQEVQLMKSY